MVYRTSLAPVLSLRREMDQLFDGAFGRALTSRGSDAPWRTSTEIREENEGWTVEIDLPGVQASDVEVTVDQGVLSVTGERRGVGTFRRDLRLSEGADIDGITAKLENGVLTLNVPKAEQAKPRKIEVK